MTQIVIFGRKLQKDGSLHENFIHRLEVAIKLSTQKNVTRIIISGGKTRRALPSESSVGKIYLQQKNIQIPIELEECSSTTMENLEYIEKVLSKTSEKVFVVISESSFDRVSCFCEWYFPHLYNKVQFVTAPGIFSLRDFLLNLPFKYLR